MRRQTVQRAGWWALVGGTTLALVLTLVLKRQYLDRDVLFLAWLCYAPVGAVVARRRPENPIGWVFLLTGFVASLALLSDAGVAVALLAGPPVAWWGFLSAWVWGSVSTALIMLPTAFTFLLYPSGLSSPRWRPVLRLAVIYTVLGTVLSALSPTLWVGENGEDPGAFEIHNPISVPYSFGSENITWLIYAPMLVFLVLASGASALLRARRSRGVERLQMRLFASSILLLLVLLVPANWLQANGYSLLRYIVLAIGFACIPLSCGVAILRYRLYDFDRIIGRTTAYALVTGVLLALYAAVVTSVTTLLPGSGDAAVAGATLAAAAAFRPVLRWARRLVDRRFNREGFDAEHALEQFAVRMRNEVDGDEVVNDLLGVLDRTLQPRSAGVWLNGSA